MGQVYGVQRDICCHGIETKLKSLINVERTIVTIIYLSSIPLTRGADVCEYQ